MTVIRILSKNTGTLQLLGYLFDIYSQYQAKISFEDISEFIDVFYPDLDNDLKLELKKEVKH